MPDLFLTFSRYLSSGPALNASVTFVSSAGDSTLGSGAPISTDSNGRASMGFTMGSQNSDIQVAAADLRAGDALSAADGRRVIVEAAGVVRQMSAPVINVYNFAVAGDHTYCVGRLGVWVHNTCPLMKEVISAKKREIALRKGWAGGTAPKGQRIKHVHESAGELCADSIAAGSKAHRLQSMTLGDVLHEAVQAELKDYNGPGDLGNIWSYKKLHKEFKDYVPGDAYDPTTGKLVTLVGGWEAHHFAEKGFMRALGVDDIPGVLDLDDSPAMPLRRLPDETYDELYRKDHGTNPPYHRAKGQGVAGKIARIIKDYEGKPDRMLIALKDLYSKPPFDHLNAWPATRDFIRDALMKANKTDIIVPN